MKKIVKVLIDFIDLRDVREIAVIFGGTVCFVGMLLMLYTDKYFIAILMSVAGIYFALWNLKKMPKLKHETVVEEIPLW